MGQITIPLGQLHWDKASWPRRFLDADRVELFAEIITSGEVLPPIEVVPKGDGTYLIADGVHRYNVARKAGRKDLDGVIVVPNAGESVQACVYRRALETATQSSLPLTTAERRTAVLRLLRERQDLSHRAIGRLVGVSHDSVDRWSYLLVETPGARKAAKKTSRPIKQRGTEPGARSPGEGAAPPAPLTFDLAAKRIVGDLAALYNTKSFVDTIAPGFAAGRLADTFEALLGSNALVCTRLLALWTFKASEVLEERAKTRPDGVS